MREAVQDAKGPLYIASLYGTKLDDIAAGPYSRGPGIIWHGWDPLRRM